ncbi:MAG: hypothetical protein ACYSSL_10710 [Planctomycetota bacterium]
MTEDVSSGFEGTLLTNGLVRIFLSEEKCCMCLDVGKRNCSRETFRRKLFFISSFRRNKT